MSKVLLCIALVVWSAITLVGDAAVLHALVRQCLSLSHAQITGEILASKIVEESDGDGGITRTFQTRYRYSAHGVEYESSTWRYGTESVGSKTGHSLLSMFPVGATVPVHFNPQHPQDAVLIPGVQRAEVFLICFFVPFNVVMVAGWLGVRAARRRTGQAKRPLERAMNSRQSTSHDPLAPAILGAFVLITTAVSGAVVVAVVLGYSLEPPFWISGCLFGCTVLSGSIAYSWKRRTLRHTPTLPESP